MFGRTNSAFRVYPQTTTRKERPFPAIPVPGHQDAPVAASGSLFDTFATGIRFNIGLRNSDSALRPSLPWAKGLETLLCLLCTAHPKRMKPERSERFVLRGSLSVVLISSPEIIYLAKRGGDFDDCAAGSPQRLVYVKKIATYSVTLSNCDVTNRTDERRTSLCCCTGLFVRTTTFLREASRFFEN